jgi:hypothetical protein
MIERLAGFTVYFCAIFFSLSLKFGWLFNTEIAFVIIFMISLVSALVIESYASLFLGGLCAA